MQLFAQTELSSIIKKKYVVKNDTIQISPVSISPYGFKVLSDLQTEIDTSNYTIDFSKAILIFKPNIQPKPTEVTIEYYTLSRFFNKNVYGF